MNKITVEKLKNNKILEQIEREIFDLENYGRAVGNVSEKIETMYELEKLLASGKDLKTTDLNLYNKLNSFLIRLKGYFMDLLTDEEVLKLFEKHFLEFIKHNVKYEDALKNFLFQKSYKERDSFLQKLREALENSREELGRYLLLGEKKAEVKGYIKNWLQDYNNFLGKELHLKMDISKYLFQSPNAKLLDAENRNHLKKLFEFYEKTKLKVNDPFGLGSYPLGMFGVEAVGEEGSLKIRFKTREGEELPEVEETTEKPGEELIPQEQEVVSAEAWARLEEKRKADAANISKEKGEKDIELQKQEARKETEARPSESPVKSVSEPRKEISFSMEGVESIKKLNADVFRKISADPAQAAEKIKSEAAKLIQANPENIIIAKEMWQQSDLYKLYLEIAQEGMETGLPVDKVIGARAKMGKPSFSKQEFEAVVDLSKVF